MNPPQNLAAEAQIIGAMLLPPVHAPDPAEVRARVGPADCYSPKNQALFAAICSLLDAGKAPTSRTVAYELPRHGPWTVTEEELEQLAVAAPLKATALEAAEVVHDLAIRRTFLAELPALGKAAETGNLEQVPRILARLGELSAATGAQDGLTWQELDLTAVVMGLVDGSLTKPVPTVGRRSDGICLFYPARVNTLIGPSGDGKTFLAQETSRQEVAGGQHVFWVDFEDDELGTASRMLDLGARPEDILCYFHYFNPLERFAPVAQEHFRKLVEKHQPSLVVIDSAGEAMSIDGTKPNDDDSVARWMRALPRFMASLGPCVIFIDHTTKARSDDLFAIGSQRKRAAVTGVAYMVEVIRELGIGQEGRSKLIVAKDRCGTFVRGSKAAEFVLDATLVPYRASLEPPEQGPGRDFRPTHLMERVSRWVELNAGCSKNAIDKAGLGKAEFVRQATEILVGDGLIRTERKGQAVLHFSTQPYRESGEQLVEEAF